MRASSLPKFIVLPFVIYATWTATSSIMGQQYKAKPASSSTLNGKLLADRFPQAALARVQGLRKMPAEAHFLGEFSINANERFVDVHATVSLMSQDVGPIHLWRLRVLEEDTKVVIADFPYMEQQFQMEKSGSMKPTFDDRLQLRPGRYRVILALYRLPENVEVAAMLADKTQLKSATLINVPRVIEVRWP